MITDIRYYVSAGHNLVRIVNKDIIDKSSRRATNLGWFVNCRDYITALKSSHKVVALRGSVTFKKIYDEITHVFHVFNCFIKILLKAFR